MKICSMFLSALHIRQEARKFETTRQAFTEDESNIIITRIKAAWRMLGEQNLYTGQMRRLVFLSSNRLALQAVITDNFYNLWNPISIFSRNIAVERKFRTCVSESVRADRNERTILLSV